MEHEFSAKIEPAGRKSSISIDGQELPYVRSFNIDINANKVSKINIEMLILKPFEINGKGKITVDSKVINREIAKEVYESLKKIFD